MALSSPGTQITIIDESQYLPAAPNSIPLVILATAQNKINASGTGVAAATTKANAGKLYQVTSQRDLITYFGNPFFYKTTSGTPIQGYELNEYGLLAAYSVLGSTNLIYAIRADIDLASLVGKTSRPSSSPDNGSWWLNTDSSTWGIFEFDKDVGTFTNKKPLIITDADNVASDGQPLASIGNVGDYAVVLVYGSGSPDSYSTYWHKVVDYTTDPNGTKWVAVGDTEWLDNLQTVTGTVTSPVITSATDGNIIISSGDSNTVTVNGTLSNGVSPTVAGTTLLVTEVVSGSASIAVGTQIRGYGIPAGTYVTALGTGTGGVGTYTVSAQNTLTATKTATVTGGISATAGVFTAAGTVLNVTAVSSGTLEIGTHITGTSLPITAGSFESGFSHTITSLGTTDWTLIGASSTAVMSGFIGNGGVATALTNVQMAVTAVTSGTLAAGSYISDGAGAGASITAGTSILSQLYNFTVEQTVNTTALLGATTITLNASTNVAVGQLVLAVDTSGNPRAGIPAGTTVTAVNGNIITLSNAITVQADPLDNLKFYTPVSTSVAANGGLGIYKISQPKNSAPFTTITGQPAVGTSFTATGVGSGTGTATMSIAPGTYISGLGTGTGGIGTYTVSTSQLVKSGTVTGYQNTLIGTSGTIISVSVADTVNTIRNSINAADVPFLRTSSLNNKINMFLSKIGGSLIIGGDYVTLRAIGIPAGTYSAPEVVYGTNAAQPLWRSTDSNPHPTGSVWIKTNSANSGMNLSLNQYSSATGAYSSKTVTVSTSDQAVNNTLDATGGKAIPLNTVYACVAPTLNPITALAEQHAPVQFFYRAQAGASVFTGTVSSPTGFEASSQFAVQVSQPGSATMLPSDTSGYTITLPATGTGTSGAIIGADFVTAWTAANIPYTKCELDSVTGAIVLTHTEGGIISLSDSPSLNANPAKASPLVVAGFTPYDMATSTGTLGAKQGIYKTNNVTATAALATTGGSGAGLTVTLTTIGYTPTFGISTGGSTYAVGDIVAVTGGNGLGGGSYQVKVTSVDGTGLVTGLQWYSGLATPLYAVLLSAWESFDYVSQANTPVNQATDGTPWFYSVVNQVDIMVNVGGMWCGYQKALYDTSGLAYATGTATTNATGPIISASEPATQNNGNDLVYGDIWIDTSDLENYPIIKRWQLVSGTKQWVTLDNTDQQTEAGVLFADARWGSNGSIDPVNDAIPAIASLLTSNYVDLDAPDATIYPQGMILFNTRRSGYNVKRFTKSLFTTANYPDAGSYDATDTTNIANLPSQNYTWVTQSGLKANGSPYMGRKAQRAMVVQAMKSVIDSSSELREEATSFNLIAAPGYPELQSNMVTLNNDRNNTAYIIGDTPLRLENDANAITKWATNAAGAVATGEDGLVGRDTYLGIYYPSGIATDLTGSSVAVPASHMILRTMIYNDKVAYPWFAPAGMRRGVIDNATNIGYIDAASGEFQTTKNRVALRDVQYNNFINPIAFFQNVGLLNYGNKNSFDSQSALDRTNVARLICYIRDRLQVAVRPFIFEPNDNITRSQVKGVVQTLMADIQAKRGIYDYLIVCDTSNNTAARIDRSELWIDIAIEPVKAVEFIYIPVRILNTGEIAAAG